GGVQFLIRSDDDLAVIEGRGRLAGQRDSVIANDIDTHGWSLLIDPTAGAAGDPHSRSVCRATPVYSGQSYENYWARAEHAMLMLNERLFWECAPHRIRQAFRVQSGL